MCCSILGLVLVVFVFDEMQMIGRNELNAKQMQLKRMRRRTNLVNRVDFDIVGNGRVCMRVRVLHARACVCVCAGLGFGVC